MGMPLDVARYRIKNAILPTIEVQLRTKNQQEKNMHYSAAVCEVYFGKEIPLNHNNSPYITSVPVVIGKWVRGHEELEFWFDLPFSQEILFLLSKRVASGDDAQFIIQTNVTLYHLDQSNKVEHASSDVGQCVLEVKMSDWLRLSAVWGRDMTLVPMLPKTHEKLLDALKLNKHLKSVDELVDELLTLHGNKT